MDSRVFVRWTMACRDENGELDPDNLYDETKEFPNVIQARRWAKNHVKAGRTDLGVATVRQQERDDMGQWCDVSDPEIITVARRVT